MSSWWEDEVIAKLAQRLQEGPTADSHISLGPPGVAAKVDRERSTRIAATLLETALRNGMVLSKVRPRFQDLYGGNTALQVSITSMQLDFVFKQDLDQKLVREARTIEDLRADLRLGGFRHRLPKIYALHDSEEPYAYLMEFFDDREYASLRQILFDRSRFDPPTPAEAVNLVEHVFEALAEAYVNSRDPRQQIRMMGEAYYTRMLDNLTKAAELSSDFQSIALSINGLSVRPWRESLVVLEERQALLQQLAAPFVTVVHGDPNPGNILIRRDGAHVRDIKFIDLKDWKHGDYIFDVAKLTHFLLYTGPAEELNAIAHESTERSEDLLKIQYSLTPETFLTAAARRIEEKAEQKASELSDREWRLRYKLAMASNLLGLVPGRHRSGMQKQAVILYGEGMKYLEDFRIEFEKREFQS